MKSFSWPFGEVVVDLRETRGFLTFTATGSATMVMVSATVFLGLPFFFTTSAVDIVLIKL